VQSDAEEDDVTAPVRIIDSDSEEEPVVESHAPKRHMVIDDSDDE